MNRTVETRLKALKELTDHAVRELSDLVAYKDSSTVKYLSRSGGGCEGYNIATSSQFSIQKCIMNKGDSFDSHIHKVHEWVILLEGRCEFVIEDNVGAVIMHKLVNPGDFVYIAPGFKHLIPKVDTEVVLLGITIPPSQSYPGT